MPLPPLLAFITTFPFFFSTSPRCYILPTFPFNQTMSIISELSSNSDKLYKKSLHRRNDSDELDVFEAAGYFSGYNDTHYGNSLLNQKKYKEADNNINNNNKNVRKGGRMSLDLPLRRNINEQEENPIKDEKIKNRQQPSSPGGRLASFLNSLFNQSSSKKKKVIKSKAAPSKNEDHEFLGGGRRRRSSLSSLIDYSKSSSNSSSSSSIQTPLKNNYKEMRSYFDKKKLQVSKKMEVVDEDEGGESDSSSDLFELRIYDLDCYSSSSTGLPLYQTTKPSLPISTI